MSLKLSTVILVGFQPDRGSLTVARPSEGEDSTGADNRGRKFKSNLL